MYNIQPHIQIGIGNFSVTNKLLWYNRIEPFFVFNSVRRASLLLVLLVGNNVVELEGVVTLGGGDNSDPVSELLLLQVLLGQVLEVLAGELSGRDNGDNITVGGDLDVLTKLVGSALDLDSLSEELLERGNVEDAVGGGSLAVNGVLVSLLSLLYVSEGS